MFGDAKKNNFFLIKYDEIYDFFLKNLKKNKYIKFKGLNLTIETLDGLLKHNGPIHNTSQINKILGLKNFYKKIIFNKSPSLEAQISSISDDIAYNNHDIQDGIQANLFKLEDLIEINFFKEINFDIRPEAMNISWDDIDNCLKTLKDFVIKNNLWYGICNELDYSKNIFLELKENVENIYK